MLNVVIIFKLVSNLPLINALFLRFQHSYHLHWCRYYLGLGLSNLLALIERGTCSLYLQFGFLLCLYTFTEIELFQATPLCFWKLKCSTQRNLIPFFILINFYWDAFIWWYQCSVWSESSYLSHRNFCLLT